MQLDSLPPAYFVAELQARQYREEHDFRAASRSAGEAAEIALAAEDCAAEWDMRFFQVENLLDAGEYDESARLAAVLVAGSSAALSAQLRARAHILMSQAKHRAGFLEEAAASARTAADLTADDADLETNVKARHALIAAQADSGLLEEAWAESLVLASIISDDVDEQLAGKAYWVIGNVAFLCNMVEEGLRYHELAAATFSPARNLDVWAKFNKASAAMRLAADIADADTLRCIERAELATDVIGGSPNDFNLLKLNRAHWTYLAGDVEAAISVLNDLCGLEEGLSPQRTGEACLLLGRAYIATGDKIAARRALAEAAAHFESAGAPHRAQQTRDFVKAELGGRSFKSWLVRVMGSGRS
ncbi:hypothetical protein SAMN04487916_11232 [Arthrobacter sp. ov407]|uniref:hypothetical protein n=1 Tax=Arthrobacter sp. ov407 TaxID=1761748 RepID=UPI00088437EF|nr:hypothetical protein [Arthrobacter sp. ov407]SDL65414.1 hypothetical protein SAMN04487916_11232 [Arthrobacter sp. ov407]